MAADFLDGFDKYKNLTAPYGLYGTWTQAPSSPATITLLPGRFGGSLMRHSANGVGPSRNFTPTDTFCFGVAVRAPNGLGAPNAFFNGAHIHIKSSSTYMIGLDILANGTVAVKRGNGTAFNTYPATYIAGPSSASDPKIGNNVWDYIEIAGFIHDTTGWIKVWIDGTKVIDVANIDTRNGTPTTVDNVELGGWNNAGSNEVLDFDDTYGKTDGVALGELKCTIINPVADTATKAFTPSNADATGAHRYWRCKWDETASAPYTISTLEMHTAIGGATVCTGGTAFASTAGNGAAASAFDTNPGTFWGANSGTSGTEYLGYDFGAGNAKAIREVKVVARNDGFFSQCPISGWLEWSDDNVTWNTAWYFNSPLPEQGAAYAYSAAFYPGNAGMVSDQAFETNDYVQGTNVGDKDLYDLEDVPANSTIIAVQPFMWAAKTDTGARQANVSLHSGATDSDGPNFALNSTPGTIYRRPPLVTDPNTAAAWTVAAINALQAGPKIAA